MKTKVHFTCSFIAEADDKWKAIEYVKELCGSDFYECHIQEEEIPEGHILSDVEPDYTI